jgi:predicted carbohydrate-binding protein with CBM5 and CBM33 domain
MSLIIKKIKLMGKFFVTIKNYNSNYKLSKEDIERVYSIRKHRTPSIPRYQAA